MPPCRAQIDVRQRERLPHLQVERLSRFSVRAPTRSELFYGDFEVRAAIVGELPACVDLTGINHSSPLAASGTGTSSLARYILMLIVYRSQVVKRTAITSLMLRLDRVLLEADGAGRAVPQPARAYHLPGAAAAAERVAGRAGQHRRVQDAGLPAGLHAAAGAAEDHRRPAVPGPWSRPGVLGSMLSPGATRLCDPLTVNAVMLSPQRTPFCCGPPEPPNTYNVMSCEAHRSSSP